VSEQAQPRAPGPVSPPAVGGQVIKRPPQVPLGVAPDRPPAPEQALERGLEQILAVGAAAREQHRRPQQVLAPGGEEFLEYRDGLGGGVVLRPRPRAVCTSRIHPVPLVLVTVAHQVRVRRPQG
jgi:hypothetical protein